jgi:hypothetical protein
MTSLMMRNKKIISNNKSAPASLAAMTANDYCLVVIYSRQVRTAIQYELDTEAYAHYLNTLYRDSPIMFCSYAIKFL